jgi:8-oxo-dGTP pyrophosphatase MutT (NUDIX family)
VRDDPIVEETRAARRELHEEFGRDPAALFRYLKKIEAANADRLVKLEPKPAVQTNRKG